LNKVFLGNVVFRVCNTPQSIIYLLDFLFMLGGGSLTSLPIKTGQEWVRSEERGLSKDNTVQRYMSNMILEAISKQRNSGRRSQSAMVTSEWRDLPMAFILNSINYLMLTVLSWVILVEWRNIDENLIFSKKLCQKFLPKFFRSKISNWVGGAGRARIYNFGKQHLWKALKSFFLKIS
jgi:hypothetical protein